MDEIRARALEIAAATQTTIAFKTMARAAPAAAAPEVQAAIERAAKSLRLESSRLPSGAGHDAQMMARLGPMGMIFVPSVGGVSHSPKELTRLAGLRQRRRRPAAHDPRDGSRELRSRYLIRDVEIHRAHQQKERRDEQPLLSFTRQHRDQGQNPGPQPARRRDQDELTGAAKRVVAPAPCPPLLDLRAHDARGEEHDEGGRRPRLTARHANDEHHDGADREERQPECARGAQRPPAVVRAASSFRKRLMNSSSRVNAYRYRLCSSGSCVSSGKTISSW